MAKSLVSCFFLTHGVEVNSIFWRDPVIPTGSLDPGITNSPFPNSGIGKTGPGLQSLNVNSERCRTTGVRIDNY